MPSVQKASLKDVQALISVLEEMGNPFTEDSTELIVLDTKEIMPECVFQAIKTAKQKGQSQYYTFVEEKLVKCSKARTDTIHRNKLPLFGTTENPANVFKEYFVNIFSSHHIIILLGVMVMTF